MSYHGYILCILTVFVFRLFSSIIEFSLEANLWVFNSAFLNNSIIFHQHRTILLDQLVALSQTQCIQLRPLTGNTYLLSLVLQIQNEEAPIFSGAIFQQNKNVGYKNFPSAFISSELNCLNEVIVMLFSADQFRSSTTYKSLSYVKKEKC